MLKHTILLLIGTLLVTNLQAQNTLASSDNIEIPTFEFKVREETRQMERATANAFVLSYPIADWKVVSQSWKKYARGLKGKLKYDRRINEYFVDNGAIDGLSENTIDITAKIYNTEEETELAIWFNLGVTYLNASEYPERYQAAEKMLRDFDAFVYAELLRGQIKEEEKQLRQMERELKKIERDRKREEKAIQRAERDIKKAQKAIEASKEEMTTYDKTLEEKKALETRQTTLIKKMKDKIKSVR